MKHLRFYEFLTSNAELDEEITTTLLDKCRGASYKKGDYLLRQGELSKHAFFVEQGLLRQYSIDEKGKEHILQFAPENWFVSDRDSAYFNQPSSYFIQAMEDTEVILVDEALFIHLSTENKSFLQFHSRLLHNHIRHLQKRITQLQSATAEERYLEFIKIYPDIMLRVSQAMIASYLGITPESLSRVRKDLAHRNFKK